MSKWIDCENGIVGTIGYLVGVVDTSRGGGPRYSLRERPARTNQSHEARLEGWCGETDNRSVTADGAWKIVRVNAAGDRAQIVRLEGASLAAFLEGDGHPELCEVKS